MKDNNFQSWWTIFKPSSPDVALCLLESGQLIRNYFVVHKMAYFSSVNFEKMVVLSWF